MNFFSKILIPVMLALLVSALGALTYLWSRVTEELRVEKIETSRFGTVSILLPPDEPQGFSLYLAPSEGNDKAPVMAETLAQLGLGVALLDSNRYLETINTEEVDNCVLFSGELTRLSQVLQKQLSFSKLFIPLLAGHGNGSAIALSALSQSPKDFKGALVLNFCPSVELRRPLCEEDGLTSTGSKPYNLTPPHDLNAPVLLWNEPSMQCERDIWQAFVASLKRRSIKEKPFFAGDLSRFIRGYDFFEQTQNAGEIAELPVIDLIPTSGPGDDLVIFMSGDGGWATIDKEIGETLREHGVTVVGFDTLKYFWKRRSPEKIVIDIERIIQHYSSLHEFKRISLIGFSFGADILGPIVNLLDEETRQEIYKIILLNPGLHYDYEVTINDWLDTEPPDGNPIINELVKLDPRKLVCVYTKDEEDESACPLLNSDQGQSIQFQGDHHFDGDYLYVAEQVLGYLGSDQNPPMKK